MIKYLLSQVYVIYKYHLILKLLLVRFIRRGITREIQHTNETWAQPHKAWTPFSTQNLKAIDLWVFILI